MTSAAVAVTRSPFAKPVPAESFVNHGTNAEMRWEAVHRDEQVTRVGRFFVRNHTATPTIDPDSYQLKIFGDGLRGEPGSSDAVTFSYDALRSLPASDLTALVECTGNGRSFFGIQQGTPIPDTPWKLGAVGLGRWRGVRLSELLERAGLLGTAVDVMATGLDPSYVTQGVDYGRVRRPIPIGKALDDAMVVWQLNGESLPPDSGFPARLLVPGWVGVASIKWLGSLEVSTTPLASPWNTRWYRMTGPGYPVDSPPLTAMPVKSAFELAWNAELPIGPTTLHGRSWSGEAAIERVDVSVDGGGSWCPSDLVGPNPRYGWTRWQVPWMPRSTGTYELMARATDLAGRQQPDTVPFNDGGYLFSAVVRHPVQVRDDG